MKIQVTVKNVYGNELVYPECDTAKKLAKLADRKTFTHSDLMIIRELGYSIEAVLPRSARKAIGMVTAVK